MTTRQPIVVIAGRTKEVPTGDVLDPAKLGSNTPDVTRVLRGDSTWAVQWQQGETAMFAHSMG